MEVINYWYNMSECLQLVDLDADDFLKLDKIYKTSLKVK